MKRWLAVLMAALCVILLGACQEKLSEEEADPTHVYFVAEVVELLDGSLMVRVTDPGDSGTAVGTDAALFLRNVTLPDGLCEGDLIRVEFDGLVQESYPIGIPNIDSIVKIGQAA